LEGSTEETCSYLLHRKIILFLKSHKNGTFLFSALANYCVKYLLFFSLLLIVAFSNAYAQNKQIETLFGMLETAKEDTQKVKILNDLNKKLRSVGKYDDALKYANEGKELSEKLKYKKGLATSYNNIGMVKYLQGYYSEALSNYFNSLKLWEELSDQKNIAYLNIAIAVVYDLLGNYPESLNAYYKALKICESIEDINGIAATYSNLGLIYEKLGKYDEALKNYNTAIFYGNKLENKNWIANIYGNIAKLFRLQAEKTTDKNLKNKLLSDAMNYNLLSLEIREKMGDKHNIATLYSNISNLYHDMGDFEEANKYNFMALKLSEELGDNYGIALSNCNIGGVFLSKNNASEAKKYLDKSLAVSKQIESKEQLRQVYYYLSIADSALGNYKESLNNYKLFIAYKDSLINEENEKALLQKQLQYEFDKKEALSKAEFDKQQSLALAEIQKRQILLERNKQALLLLEQENELKELRLLQSEVLLKQKETEAENQQKTIALLNKENEIKAAEAKQKEEALKKHKVIIYSTSIGVLLVLALLGVAVYGYRQKQKANEIITQQKLLVEKQKEIVEEKQKEILDSIHYAKRIQMALLTSEFYIEKQLKRLKK
jgi:tetratricopeptide (TPR) repeat protein